MLSHCRKMRNTLQDFTERLCRRGEQSHHQTLRHATGPLATIPCLPAEHRGDSALSGILSGAAAQRCAPPLPQPYSPEPRGESKKQGQDTD